MGVWGPCPLLSIPKPQALFCCQGTYVLQDNSFPLLIAMGSGPQYLEEAPKVLGEGQGMPTLIGLSWGWGLASPLPTLFCPPPPPQFLAFTCGLLCGALHTLGFQSLVTASVASLPACKSLGDRHFASLKRGVDFGASASLVPHQCREGEADYQNSI